MKAKIAHARRRGRVKLKESMLTQSNARIDIIMKLA